jgi:hypothetical protein
MHVGEPAAGFGFVFEVAVVMVPAEEDLDVCCCKDSRAEEVVYGIRLDGLREGRGYGKE